MNDIQQLFEGLEMVFSSIKSRAILVLLMVFSAVLVVATIQANERRISDVSLALKELTRDAKAIAGKQEDAANYVRNLLKFLIQSVDLNELSRDENCVEKMRSLVFTGPAVANIFIAGLDGGEVCNAFPSTGPANVSDRSYFQRASSSSGMVMDAPVFGRFTQKWVLPFAQSFKDASGKKAGVLVVALDLGWVNAEFNKRDFHADTRIGLVTAKGTVLARYPEPDQWVGKDISHHSAFQALLKMDGVGTLEEQSHDGQSRIYAFQRFTVIDGETIYFWINQPLESVTLKAYHQFYSAMGLTFILIVFTFLITWHWGRRMLIQPIEAIVGAAHRLSLGDSNARTGIQHGMGEIGELAEAFDEMAFRLTRVDFVTGLPNQYSVEERLGVMVQQSAQRDKSLSVLQLEVVNFSNLADKFGFDVADELLRRIASKLQNNVSSECVVGRIGRGVFIIACPDIHGVSEASILASKFLEAIKELSVVDDHEVFPDVNIGVCFYPADGLTPKELVERAGLALAQLKSQNKGYVGYFDGKMNDLQLKKMTLVHDLHHAIIHQQLELHFQPQFDLKVGRFIGFEALARWRHPSRGYVSPAEFIPLAEESGLILPLGNLILKLAAAQMVLWRRAGVVEETTTIAVNVSSGQMASTEFFDCLRSVLRNNDLPPQCIELELTESILISDVPQTQQLLRQFKELGLQLSIDDFGTGYSSLAYLRDLEVDKLKIDKSFVDDIHLNANTAAIVEATIAMAHGLGLIAIAEGVESEAQLDALRLLKCDQIQGYYYSKPLPATELVSFLKAQGEGLCRSL